MSSLIRTALAPVTALGLLLASPAIAQAPAQNPHHPKDAAASAAPAAPGMMMPMMGGQMMPMGHMMGGGMMGMMHKHPEGYFAFLKTEIGITDAQNTVWKAYTDQLRALIKKHQDAMPMQQKTPTNPPTWIEKLTDREAMMSEHLEGMKKIRPAATALYAALSPEQKKKADTLMPGAMGMKMGGM